MTAGCTKQACDFTDSLSSLKAAGYEVVGISPDSPAKLAKFRERDGLTITLVSDADKSVMQAYGAYGEKKLYGKVVEGVIRSTFVVDEDGKIELAQYNVKATGHVAKLRRDLGTGCLTLGSVRTRRSGGTGRHAGFRSLCLRVCGFESRLRHLPFRVVRAVSACWERPRPQCAEDYLVRHVTAALPCDTWERRLQSPSCVAARWSTACWPCSRTRSATATTSFRSSRPPAWWRARARSTRCSAGCARTSWSPPSGATLPAGPPRRYYALTRPGQRALDDFRSAWTEFAAAVESILQPQASRRSHDDCDRHPFVEDYLRRLWAEAARLPVDQARELEADITNTSRPRCATTRPRPRCATSSTVSARRGSWSARRGRDAPTAREPSSFSSPVGALGCLSSPSSSVMLMPDRRGALGGRPGAPGPGDRLDRAREAARLARAGHRLPGGLPVLPAWAWSWSPPAARCSSNGPSRGGHLSGGGRHGDSRRVGRDARLRSASRSSRSGGWSGLSAAAMSGPISRSALPRWEIASLSGGVSSAVVTPGRSSASNTTS